MTILEDLREAGVDEKAAVIAAKAELNRRRTQARLLANPYAFYMEMICPPEWRELVAPMHKEGLEFVNTGKKKKLILWPRKHLKSSVFTEGETIRRAMVNPNIRIQLNTAVSDNAKRFLSSIRGHLQSERFIEVFGALVPGPNNKQYKNNAAELTLLSRTNHSLREPTFSASGVGESHTSQHYDLIVHDDLMNRDNVANIEQIEKVITHYKDSLDLLENDGEMWVIGTRWHPLDISGWILEALVDARCEENDFVHVSNKCKCIFDVTHKEVKMNEEYIFPATFNDEVIEVLLLEKDRYEFACQYLNNPIDPSACWFSQTDVKRSLFDPASKEYVEETRPGLVWYAAVDPAESLKQRSSYTAATVVGIDFSKTPAIWYVDYAVRSKVETPGFCDLCIDIHRKYPNMAAFGIEQNTRKALGYALKQQMIQENHMFEFKEMKPSDVKAPGGNKYFTKELRIKRLLPLFSFGNIRVNKNLKDLLDELYTLPSARTWDITDSLSYIMSLVPEGAGGIDSTSLKMPTRVIGWERTGF